MNAWIVLLFCLAATVGSLPFFLKSLQSPAIQKRIEISIILLGAMFSVVAAGFLFREYKDQKQARITRSWQLLYQAQDRAREVVCNVLDAKRLEKDPTEIRPDCSEPPPIPEFMGKHKLVCQAIQESDNKMEGTDCTRESVAVRREHIRKETGCSQLLDNGLLDDDSKCRNPIAEKYADAFAENFTIGLAMQSHFGQFDAVQSLFDEGRHTQGLDLRWFDLEKIVAQRDQDLRRANLSGTNLRDAKMVGVILGEQDVDRGANLSGARLSGADFSRAHLGYADLSDVYADRPIFAGAKLRQATLHYAIFNNADLSGADLSYADLFEATLRGADLSGATLDLADLTGAHLSQVDGLTQDELDKACASSDNQPTIQDSDDSDTKRSLEWRGGECH